MYEKKLKIKKISRVLGAALVIGSVVFIIFSLIEVDYSAVKKQLSYEWIFLSLTLAILYSLTVVICAVAWNEALKIASPIVVPLKSVTRLYMKANAAKYIPGNVFHFAGRHLLVGEKGVSHKALLFSNTLEIGLMILTSGLIASAGIFTGSAKILRRVASFINLSYILGFIIFCAISVIFIAVYLAIKKRFLDILHEYFRKKNISHLVRMIFLYVLSFVITGTLLYLLLLGISGGTFKIKELILLICFFSLAWVLGYIVPGAPGGMGIRETVLILMLSDLFQNFIIVGVLLFRIITVAGDVLALVVSHFINENQRYLRKME